LATHGTSVHQSLTHRFVLRSNEASLSRLASRFINDFAPEVSDAQPPPHLVYSLSKTSGADGRPLFTLDRDDQRLISSDDPGEVLSQLLWAISGDTVERARGYLMVHAGAVVKPNGDAVVILGEAGSGKTTLVAALVQDGFGFLSDEAAAIELRTGLAHPWPRPLGFRPGTRSLERFRSLSDMKISIESHVPIGEIRRGAISGPAPVRVVIDHVYKPGAATRLEPLSRAVGLVRMGSAAPRLRHEGERGLEVLAEVMRGARAYSLIGGELEETVRAVRDSSLGAAPTHE
jgi:hypothetical protein